MNQADQQQLSPDRYWRVFLRRKWLAIAVILIGMPIAGLVWFIVPAKYQAMAWLDIGFTPAEKHLGGSIGGAGQTREAEVRYDKAKKWLTGRPVIKSTVTDPPVEGLAPGYDVGDPIELDSLIQNLQKRIRVDRQGEEQVLVSFSHRDPNVADSFVKRLMNALTLIWTKDSQSEHQLAVEQWKLEIRDRIDPELNLATQLLAEFREDNAAVLASGDLANVGRELAELQEQISEIEGEKRSQKKKKQFFDGVLQDTKPTIEAGLKRKTSANIKMEILERRIAELETSLILLKVSYQDGHKNIRITEKQLEGLKEERKNTEQTEDETESPNPDYLTYREKLTDCELEIDKLDEKERSRLKRKQELEDAQKQLPKALKGKEENEQKVESLRARKEKAVEQMVQAQRRLDLAERGGMDAFRLLDRVFVSDSPSNRDRHIYAVVMALITICMAIALPLGIELVFKPSLIVVDDARKFLSIPSLGVVPVMYTTKDTIWRWIRRGMATAAIAIEVAALCLVFFVFREEVDAWVGASWISPIAEDILTRLGI